MQTPRPSDQPSIRDEIIATIYATPTPAGIQSEWPFPVTVTELADGLLASPVIRRIQADALREAAESLNREFQDIPAWREAYIQGVRTQEWMTGGARMVVSALDVLLARADRIEKGDIS